MMILYQTRQFRAILLAASAVFYELISFIWIKLFHLSSTLSLRFLFFTTPIEKLLLHFDNAWKKKRFYTECRRLLNNAIKPHRTHFTVRSSRQCFSVPHKHVLNLILFRKYFKPISCQCALDCFVPNKYPVLPWELSLQLIISPNQAVLHVPTTCCTCTCPPPQTP